MFRPWRLSLRHRDIVALADEWLINDVMDGGGREGRYSVHQKKMDKG